MKLITTGVVAVGLVVGAFAGPTVAHERDLMTPSGKVGPIRTNESTIADMKRIFGEPRSRDVVRVGCSKVVRLRWRQIQTFSYRKQETVVDVRVRSARVASEDGVYRFHTSRGLRVGDSEAELRRAYPQRKGYAHDGHTHYTLGGDETKLVAKVVGGRVTELEAAPYEFC